MGSPSVESFVGYALMPITHRGKGNSSIFSPGSVIGHGPRRWLKDK